MMLLKIEGLHVARAEVLATYRFTVEMESAEALARLEACSKKSFFRIRGISRYISVEISTLSPEHWQFRLKHVPRDMFPPFPHCVELRGTIQAQEEGRLLVEAQLVKLVGIQYDTLALDFMVFLLFLTVVAACRAPIQIFVCLISLIIIGMWQQWVVNVAMMGRDSKQLVSAFKNAFFG
jgi:hypothetical protein